MERDESVVEIERDSMEFDVVIVGAGPAGLATAIRLKQLAAEKNQEINVCVLEKGAEVGAHILAGAVIDPESLTELLPDWKKDGAPLQTEVTHDEVLFLTATGTLRTPEWAIPPGMKNHGAYIGSAAQLVRWLGEQAEALGVEVYPGFPAARILYGEEGQVRGVITGDMGVGRDGKPTDAFQPGMELLGRYVVFAEGSRGHLGRELMERFQRQARIDNVLDDQHVFAFDVAVQVFQDAHHTRRRRRVAVGGHRHEFHLARDGQLTREVRQKYRRAFQHAHQQQIIARIVLGHLIREDLDALSDFFFADQHRFNIAAVAIFRDVVKFIVDGFFHRGVNVICHGRPFGEAVRLSG